MKLQLALKNDEISKPFTIKRFEELFGLIYTKELQFNDWETEQWIRKKCERVQKNGKIGQLAQWLGSYHSRELSQGEIPSVEIRWIHQQIGYGLFASEPFKKWQYIGEYTGLLRRRNLFFPNINDYCFMYPKYWLSTRAYTIDSEKHGNYTRFINHSDFPNCESVAVFHDGVFHILFRAIKEIQAGEEFTYDYGGIYWLRRKKIREEPFESLIPSQSAP